MKKFQGLLGKKNQSVNLEPVSQSPVAPEMSVNSGQNSTPQSPSSGGSLTVPPSPDTALPMPPDPVPAGNPSTTSQTEVVVSIPAAMRDDRQDLLLNDLMDVKIGQPQSSPSSGVFYPIHCKFRTREIEVKRRFDDFIGLYNKLVAKHLPEGHIVPPAPANSISNTSLLERYLQYTMKHPKLGMDPDLREFLVFDGVLLIPPPPPVFSTSPTSWFSNTIAMLNQPIVHFPETDLLLKVKAQKLEKLESTLKKLHEVFETLVMHRREVESESDALNKSLVLLSNCEDTCPEDTRTLSRVYTSLSNSHQTNSAVFPESSQQEFLNLSEELRYIMLFIAAVKSTFSERVKCWRTYNEADEALDKKRAAKYLLELEHKTDKLPAAEKEIKELEEKMKAERKRFERITETLKEELKWFEQVFTQEIKRVVTASLEALLINEQKVMEAWEEFGNDLRGDYSTRI